MNGAAPYLGNKEAWTLIQPFLVNQALFAIKSVRMQLQQTTLLQDPAGSQLIPVP